MRRAAAVKVRMLVVVVVASFFFTKIKIYLLLVLRTIYLGLSIYKIAIVYFLSKALLSKALSSSFLLERELPIVVIARIVSKSLKVNRKEI